MKKLYTPVGILFYGLFFAMVLCMSCQSNSEKKEVDGGTTPIASSSAVSAPIPTIYLDSLSIPADSVFKTPADKVSDIVFEYYLGDSTITLHGWQLKYQKPNPGQKQFNPNPNVKLIPGKKSQVAISSGTYLGNQVLWAKDVKKIAGEVAGKKTILYFTPKNDSGSATVYYTVSYRHMITADGTSPLLLTSYTTNPSPPHQSFDN